MVTGRTGAPALVLALGLAVPLVVGGGFAVVALTRSPMESNAVPEPVVATVGRAERLEAQATTVTWVPADTFAVRSQSAGTITALSIVAGTALADGDVAMVVDGAPVVAYAAPAPLHRDIASGMTGDDVATAQQFLVAHGYLHSVDEVVGPAVSRAIAAFNADHGRGSSTTLSVGSLLWVPGGSGAPQSVTVRVGDTVAPQDELYTTSTIADQVAVSAAAADVERTLTVAGARISLAPGVTAITDPNDVATVRREMAGEPTVSATLATSVAREVGTVPASAVIVDVEGSACYFTGVDGEAVRIEAETGSFGLVDVAPDLIGTPVLTDPRQAGMDLSCG